MDEHLPLSPNMKTCMHVTPLMSIQCHLNIIDTIQDPLQVVDVLFLLLPHALTNLLVLIAIYAVIILITASRQNASKSQNPKSFNSDPYSRSSTPQNNSVAPKPKQRRPPGPPFRKGPSGMNTLHTSNSSQLLRVHGTVSNIPNLLCTLDSASAVSMMTVSTARRHGFSIFPSDITINLPIMLSPL